MTIQDALERAKRLHKERQQVTGGSAPRRSTIPHEETVSLVALRDELAAGPEVHETFPELDRIEFDLATCERNHILASDSQLAEGPQEAAAYRLLRGRVQQRIRAGGWSCVGITSPGPGEGKTTTTLNLAISIAREKQRMVYLIDLDMRNASVLGRVGVQIPRVLSQYFTEDLPADRVLYSTGLDNLVVAGDRDNVRSASELLASPRLDELIKYIRRRSKGALILFDLPPVLSTDEALVVAPRTDAMFMVVSEGVTRRDGLARAMDLLSDHHVAGVILNRSTERMGADYYAY